MMDLARSHVFDSNNHRGKWMASESPALTLTLSGHRPKVGRERGPICRPGLSPHAPYSVHLDLLKAVIELSKVHQVPVAMHLAESHEELELLRCGTGPLRAFLEELGAWSQSFIPLGTRPMDFLRLLASAHRALIVHGNYLDDEEIAFLGANAAHIAAVYCPRTHDWFAHAPYPLEKMLAAGATVAVGTDGRGSSPDLNLFEELRFAARRHPDVAWSQILRMGTMDGAKALGREKEIGSLAEGKQADLAIVALPDRDAADPHELLFDSAEPVTACYCRGEEAYRLEINN
jgi:cytosine/adenosine deaminase-related metal-dependent hydrolase